MPLCNRDGFTLLPLFELTVVHFRIGALIQLYLILGAGRATLSTLNFTHTYAQCKSLSSDMAIVVGNNGMDIMDQQGVVHCTTMNLLVMLVTNIKSGNSQHIVNLEVYILICSMLRLGDCAWKQWDGYNGLASASGL